ncbi:BTB/POZ and MATH domain-containing protein 3-like [Triticum aestivum]|nr:BTB/POZ and MATH domain-containing protein 3-like [Triticum aestivum]
MSALLSTMLRAGRQRLTASIVTGRQPITVSHVLQIHGYKQIKKMVPNGKAVESAPFDVAGRACRIRCYPNGSGKKHYGYTSLFLTSHCDDGTVRLELSVLDRDGNPSRTRATEKRRFWIGDSWGWGFKDFVKNDDLVEGEHLVDDCLIVLCDVTVHDPSLHAEEVAAPVVAPPFDLSGELGEAMWNETDVTIHVGDETFPAHRSVLEAASAVFKADLENNGTGEVRVDDMDAQVFKTLLQFMYTSVLPDKNQLEADAATAERLLVAADRYGLEKIKVVCEEALCPRVNMGSVGTMLALAERHGGAVLKKACMEFLSIPGNLLSFMATEGFEELKRTQLGCWSFT